MKCPKCGKDCGSRVIDTRKCSDGINRQRVCFGCHIRYFTTEIVDNEQSTKKSYTLKKITK